MAKYDGNSTLSTRDLAARALSRPDQFPKEFVSWLRRFVSDNSMIHVSEAQGGGGGGSAVVVPTMVAVWSGNSAPISTGQAGGIWQVPFVDGASKTFNLNLAYFRLEGSPVGGGGSYSVKIQSGAAGGAFPSPTTIATLTVAPGNHEATSTTSLGTVVSGQLLRVFWSAIGIGASIYTVQLEGTA